MNNLKELRKKHRLTQTELASFIGITQNTYSYWENDKVKIDNISLNKLADYFNVSVDYILGRNNILKEPVKQTTDSSLNLSENQNQLLQLLQQLSPDEMAKVIDYAALIKQARK